jgi:hypothetical protein
MTLKQKLLAAGGAVVLLVGVFAAGRYSAPAKVVTVEKTKTVEVQHETTTVVQKVDLDELKQAISQIAENIQKNVVKKKVTVTTPDGSKTVTEVTTDTSRTDVDTKETTTDTTKATSTTATNTTKDDTKTTDHQVTTTVTHPSQPGFGLALQLGMNFPHAFDGSAQTNYIPQLPKQSVVGLVLERRLLGTVYGGVWGNSRGDGGVQLRLGF